MLLALPPKTRPHRRLRRLLVALTTLIVVGIIGDAAIGMMFRTRLADAVQTGMGADFSAGLAWYIPPRGVSLHHVRISKLQSDGNRQELFTASRVVIKLAEFQKPNRPCIIRSLRIDSPSITIVSRPVPPAVTTEPAVSVLTSTPTAPAPKAGSEQGKLEIRDFKLTNGQIILKTGDEDPLVIDNINLAFSPTPGSSQVYRFSAASDQNADNSLKSAGSVNVDAMTLGLTELSLQAKIGAVLSQTHLSGELRERLEMAKIDGTLSIHANASVPLDDWWRSTYSADVQLTSGKGSIPGSSLNIDSAHGEIHLQRDSGTAGVKITIGSLSAATGASALVINGGEFSTTDDQLSWELSGLLGRLDLAGGIPALDAANLKGRFLFTGTAAGPMNLPKDASLFTAVHHELVLYPRDVSVQPPKYPVPVEHIGGGPITFRAGVVRFENLNAIYGGDKVLLDEAHITLDDPAQKTELTDLRRQIKVDGISGTLICKQPGPQYPAGLGKVIAQLRPTGAFAIGGGSWFGINRRLQQEDAKPKPDYFFRVSSAGGAFSLTDRKIPLTNIHADAAISPMLIDIGNLRANALDGTVIAKTKITPVRPVVYEGSATFYNVNLQTASRDLGLKLKKPPIGKAYLKVNASGKGPGGDQSPLESFAADGEFQIVDGNFGDIQTIRAAASNVTKADQVLDGEAAGVFSIRNEKVTLDNCAVGNPLFGLEGSGTVGFNKSLDLHAVAAPLGDWREGLKRSKVPVLDDVGSDIAGAIQQLFAGAQRSLLWDIHISGTTTAPKVNQIAAPVITHSVASVFGQLIRGVKDNELIDQLRDKKE